MKKNMKKKVISFVMAIVMCLGLVAPTLADESQVPIIQSITIQPSEADPSFSITLTNVFDVFISTHIIDHTFEETALHFALDVGGTVSFSRDVNSMWGQRFIPDRSGLHPAYGGIELAARTGEQIAMSELIGFTLFYGNVQSLASIYNISHTVGFTTIRVGQQGRTLAEWNAEIVAGGSTYTLGRVSELAVPATAEPISQTPSSWAVEQVNAAITAGLVPQNLQSNYTQPTTRAEFTALAVALYETATGREITGRMEFNDTNNISVQKMAYLGVVQGVGGGNFAPNNQLTREQAAVMLARLADVIGQPFPPSAPTFADNAQVSSWAVEAVGQMQTSGIMGGVGDNRFDPSGAYTREQSIITILRLYESIAVAESTDYVSAITDDGTAHAPRSSILLPDRVLTDTELQAWIAEYYEMGGPSDFEREMVAAVNRVRVEYGLRPLELNYNLMKAARLHTQFLADLEWTRFYQGDGVRPLSIHCANPYGGSLRLVSAIFRIEGSGNMGANGSHDLGRSVEERINGWLASPGHRRNMLNPEHNYIGVGFSYGGPGGGNSYKIMTVGRPVLD